MNIAAWIVSAILAVLYLGAGAMKLIRPKDQLRADERMAWVEDFTPAMIKFIGTAEILGALGLILPKLTGIVDERGGVTGTLTGLAATGLVLIQAGAIPTHLRRHETSVLPVNVVLLVAAAFVAAARYGWLS